ncbi:MAG: amidohydrolase family protein, partial [Cyclobacteriaceae bacterium]
MEIIDAHHHFWKYQPEKFPWINGGMATIKKDFNPLMLEKELKNHGISGSIAVQAVQDEDENHFLLQHAAENDFIKGVVGWLDLKSPELQEKLNLYVPFRKLKGFRHVLQDEKDRDYILNAEFQRGLQWIFEAGYVYDLLVFPHQLKGAIKTVENFPDAPFVLDHIGKPPIKSGNMGEWKELIKALVENKNVYCKVSGMDTEADWNKWEERDFFPYL